MLFIYFYTGPILIAVFITEMVILFKRVIIIIIKWTQEWWNLIIRDVLRKDEQDHPNYWPLAIVVDAAKGKDGGVRKTTVMVYKDKKIKIFERLICTLILLVPS